MSTLKADAISSASSNTDVVITGAGSGVPDIEAGFKVGGTAGVPMASIRTSSGTASSSTFLRGDGQWQAAGGDTGESFLITMSGNQTLTTATNTKIQLDSETFDVGNNFDPTTNYRLTPTAGKWFLNMATGITSGTTTTCDLHLFKNGTYYISSQWAADISSGVTTINIVLSASGTDYYEMFVEQRHGGNKDIYASTTYFSGFRIE